MYVKERPTRCNK